MSGEVPLFKQGELASAAQGTPGVNRAAGAADANLAAGIGKVRQNEQALADMSAGIIIEGIAGATELLGRGIANMRAKRVAQQNLIDDAELANDVMQFRQFANHEQRDKTDQFADTPDKAVKAYRQSLTGEMDTLQRKWADNPRARAKLAEQLSSYVPEELDKVEGWALSRKTAIAQQSVDNNLTGEVQNISKLKGTIQERYAAFQDISHRVNDYVASVAPAVGKEKATAKLAEFNKQAGAAVFESYLTNRPDDPVVGIKYVKDARAMLDNADALRFNLSDEQKKRLRNEMDGLEGKYVKSVTTGVQIADMQDSVNMDIFRTQMNAKRDDPLFIAQSMTALHERVQEIKDQNMRVQSDPDLPDEVKVSYARWQDSHIKQVNAMMNDVHTYKSQAAAEARREAADNRREANAADRAQAAANRAQAATDRAAKAEAKAASQSELFGLKTDLVRLAASPEMAADNHAEITRLASQMFKKAGEAEKNNHVTASQAANIRQSALQIARQAAAYQNAPGWFFGFGSELKHLHSKELMKAQTSALNDLYAAIDDVKTEVRHEGLNDLQGMSAKQKEVFSAQSSKWIAQLKAAGKSPQEINVALGKLRTAVMSDTSAR